MRWPPLVEIALYRCPLHCGPAVALAPKRSKLCDIWRVALVLVWQRQAQSKREQLVLIPMGLLSNLCLSPCELYPQKRPNVCVQMTFAGQTRIVVAYRLNSRSRQMSESL